MNRPAETGLRPYTLVYIAGRSYSGITLLDLLISSHSQAAGVGELRMLSEPKRSRSRRPRREKPCTCGAESRPTCPFWSRVFERTVLATGRGFDDLDVFDDVQNRAVLDALHACSGARFVVDSSKRNDRLAQLLADDRIDVRPIHLIRDPRAQVYGHMKRGESLAASAHGYRRETRKTRRLLHGRDHLTVRYEQLARDPRRELTRIMRWLGADIEDAQLDWGTHEHHHLAGNRMRRTRDSTIRIDDAWRAQLTFRQAWEIRLRVAGLLPAPRTSASGGFDRFRRENPGGTFEEYYVARVLESIERGAPHPTLGGNLRSGPFEEAGRDVFEFLRGEGLQPSDICVDYGCGSLRVGQHLMRYLDPGNYWGLDVTDRFIAMGRELVGEETLRRAKPHLHRITPEVRARVADANPDVLLANAVLPHVRPVGLDRLLRLIASVMGPSTRAYIGARLAQRVEQTGNRSWRYSEDRLRQGLDRAGLEARIVPRTKSGSAENLAWIVATRKTGS